MITFNSNNNEYCFTCNSHFTFTFYFSYQSLCDLCCRQINNPEKDVKRTPKAWVKLNIFFQQKLN